MTGRQNKALGLSVGGTAARTNLRVLRMIPIKDIRIGKRFRKDLGNIPEFAQNMKQVGLLQPILISPDLELIAGQRRVEAYKSLGLSQIPALISRGDDVALAQYRENVDRKQFTFEEEMEIADVLEPQLKKFAEERKRAGVRPSGDLPKRVPKDGGRVSSELSKGFNEGRKTFEGKRKIWKSDHPRKQELIDGINKGGSVRSALARLNRFERRERLENAIKNTSRSSVPDGIRIGDAFKLITALPDKSVDATLTSPPFDKDIRWLSGILSQIERVTIDYAIVFNSSRRLVEICRGTTPFRVLMWYKQIEQEPFRYEPIFIYKMNTARFNINDRIHRDVLPYSPPDIRVHKDQNPLGLYVELLQLSAANIVLDPFLGSGTTYRAACNLNKKCIGFEKEPQYLPYILTEAIVK